MILLPSASLTRAVRVTPSLPALSENAILKGIVPLFSFSVIVYVAVQLCASPPIETVAL